MEEDDYIIATWAQEDVDTLYNLLNENISVVILVRSTPISLYNGFNNK